MTVSYILEPLGSLSPYRDGSAGVLVLASGRGRRRRRGCGGGRGQAGSVKGAEEDQC
uniref:Predicted protein n=1 Tax=Hordeum vulgare subsp. vulgare TaxID=112509 RepID=F2DV30_HORVV|nr:predicted protein [Hordeum vulgare subsp. vulgare]